MKDPYDNYFFEAFDAIVTIDGVVVFLLMFLLPIFYLVGNAGGIVSGILIEIGGFVLILDLVIVMVCIILWYCSSTKEETIEEEDDELSEYMDDDYFV
ncbi:MAG: hypothetical protein MJ245_01150 [Clostridia bacterium]|nr:hypothetical protein [Clostridia bacterium]